MTISIIKAKCAISIFAIKSTPESNAVMKIVGTSMSEQRRSLLPPRSEMPRSDASALSKRTIL